LFVAAAIVMLTFAVRLVLFPFQSSDWLVFLSKWYDFIKANGGFSALRFEFANYNMPYLYLIAFLTYLPVPALAAVKLVSVGFDLVLAFFTYKLVALKYPAGWRPFLAAAAVSVLPTVVTNGAMWAQCDSIYAAFGLGGVYYALRSRPWLACVFFGLALAFKMQIIFLFPVLLVLVLLRKVPWFTLPVIPAVVLALDVPALLLGADVGKLLSVYSGQVGLYPQLTLNAPNVYQFLTVNTTFDLDMVRSAGILFTGILVLVVVLLTVIRRVPLTASRVVVLATLFVILVPSFLPSMHERYFYLADVLSVVAAFYLPRRLWPVPLLVQFASFMSYAPYLFDRPGTPPAAVDLRFAAVAMLVALGLMVREFLAGAEIQLDGGHQEQQDRPASRPVDATETLEGIGS
jgi:Gpi18-like mannosyltransferase